MGSHFSKLNVQARQSAGPDHDKEGEPSWLVGQAIGRKGCLEPAEEEGLVSTAMLRQPGVARPARLPIPPGPSPNERPGRGPAFAYLVRPGDSLGAIARASGVPVAELMRRNPAMNPNFLRPTERIWVPDLLPASAGEPAQGLAQRTAQQGEVRMSADRRYVAVLDSTLKGTPNTLTVFERKSGKRISVPSDGPGFVWKRVGWSPDGRLLAIEGLRGEAEGGTLVAFDPLSGDKVVLVSPQQAIEDLRREGYCQEVVEIVSFRPIKDRITFRMALRDDPTDNPRYTEWVMSTEGSDRRRA